MPLFKKPFRKILEEQENGKRTSEILSLAKQHGWDPIRTGAGIIMAKKSGLSNERIQKLYEKAKMNRRQLIDEVLIEVSPPELREKIEEESKKYDFPIWQVYEFRDNYDTDEVFRKVIFEEASKVQKDYRKEGSQFNLLFFAEYVRKLMEKEKK
jgi:hypothetical protein